MELCSKKCAYSAVWAHEVAKGICAEGLAWAHGLSSRNVPIVLCGLLELCSKKCAYSAVWAHEVG